MAEKGSLSERYCLVLQELRVEAIRQVRRMHPAITDLGRVDDTLQDEVFQNTLSLLMNDSPDTTTDGTEMLGNPAIDFNGMPSLAFSDPSGWGQFASMVSSGLGNLDASFDDVSFDF